MVDGPMEDGKFQEKLKDGNLIDPFVDHVLSGLTVDDAAAFGATARGTKPVADKGVKQWFKTAERVINEQEKIGAARKKEGDAMHEECVAKMAEAEATTDPEARAMKTVCVELAHYRQWSGVEAKYIEERKKALDLPVDNCGRPYRVLFEPTFLSYSPPSLLLFERHLKLRKGDASVRIVYVAPWSSEPDVCQFLVDILHDRDPPAAMARGLAWLQVAFDTLVARPGTAAPPVPDEAGKIAINDDVGAMMELIRGVRLSDDTDADLQAYLTETKFTVEGDLAVGGFGAYSVLYLAVKCGNVRMLLLLAAAGINFDGACRTLPFPCSVFEAAIVHNQCWVVRLLLALGHVPTRPRQGLFSGIDSASPIFRAVDDARVQIFIAMLDGGPAWNGNIDEMVNDEWWGSGAPFSLWTPLRLAEFVAASIVGPDGTQTQARLKMVMLLRHLRARHTNTCEMHKEHCWLGGDVCKRCGKAKDAEEKDAEEKDAEEKDAEEEDAEEKDAE